MIASGTVDDYPASVQDDLRQAVADEAGVARDPYVTLDVSPASVLLAFSIETTDSGSAATIESSLAEALPSAEAATAFFSASGLTVEVESAPVVAVTVVSVTALDDDEDSGGKSAGEAAGVAVGGTFVGCLLFACCVFFGQPKTVRDTQRAYAKERWDTAGATARERMASMEGGMRSGAERTSRWFGRNKPKFNGASFERGAAAYSSDGQQNQPFSSMDAQQQPYASPYEQQHQQQHSQREEWYT